MNLTRISAPEFDVELALAYAAPGNLTGKAIYRHSACWLHPDAAAALTRAIALAGELDLKFRIFDAYRPVEAQWALWRHNPDPDFLADPRRGSPHSRGVAIDLTLIDEAGNALEMGTPFDAFTPLSHHGSTEIPVAAQQNRLILLGLMTQAGWDFYRNEWWHYQLFKSRDYPLINNNDVPKPLI